MIDLDPDSRTYKVLDWIDTTTRSIPIATRILMFFVLVFAALVFGLSMARLVVLFSL